MAQRFIKFLCQAGIKTSVMRKIFTPAIAILLCCSVFLLQGCLKDSITHTYTYTFYQPVYKTADEVRADIKTGAAQLVERPGKIFVKGNYIFLNETDKGIHVIDNSNPAQPKNVSFINIPGNIDIAVKGNTLYADLYTDLVAIDITNPQKAILKKVVEGVFPDRYYYGIFSADSTKVIASWVKRDTTVSEQMDLGGWAKNAGVFMSFAADAGGKSAAVSPYGVGGSMARFTIINERLYTVGNSDLQVFNISNTINPSYSNKKNMGWGIETIYPFMNKLFIGSQTGMFIYSLSNPDNPVEEGQFHHVRTCDPVIADGNYAYVTLRSGSRCAGFNNELDILNLSNLSNPTLVKVYSLTNPHGLSKDGNTLFICDGKDGLKIYDATNVSDLKLIKKIDGIETSDVITMGGVALVVATDGLYQYDYSNLSDIRFLSKITIAN
jgi:hypothetical protein